MGPPNYREQRTAVYDGQHKKNISFQCLNCLSAIGVFYIRQCSSNNHVKARNGQLRVEVPLNPISQYMNLSLYIYIYIYIYMERQYIYIYIYIYIYMY